ncbi:hypothetical protein NDA18_005314 [Ustilago nuda]|nr:hypothetical protein NDA18_005314 [Ustilago nuda]
MPRRKIGADLKEALCKLYEAGDISADTIEKHGIMSRATFFRNLKMYKTGASLEQRHSTGRKTNADKLKEQEKQQLDSLQPSHLSHLELVLLLDDDDKSAQGLAARNKRKAKGTAASSKRRETGKGTSGDAQGNDTAIAAGEDSGSESDGDSDQDANLAYHQTRHQMLQAVRSFLIEPDSAAPTATASYNSFADLKSLLKPEDTHYSHSNRGALFIVRSEVQSSEAEGGSKIIAAIALRSLIWTPQIYQSLGPAYASRSIDKICNLARLRVHPLWQRKGIGRWLVRAAEIKASKLGFSHLYTQSDASRSELLSFWQRTGFHEFARLHDVARLEKLVVAPMTPSKGKSSKRAAIRASPPVAASTDGVTSASSVPTATSVGDGAVQQSNHQQQRTEAKHQAGREAESNQGQANPSASELDQAIPLDPSLAMSLVTHLSTPSTTSNALATAETMSSGATHNPAALMNRPLETHAYDASTTAAAPVSIALQMPARSADASAITPATSTSSSSLQILPSHDPADVQLGPPPRRIAFHEANPTGSHPLT